MYIQALMARGLNESEAKQFMELFHKITPTQEDIDAFYVEMDEVFLLRVAWDLLKP